MYLRRFIKLVLLTVLLFSLDDAYGQSDTIIRVPSPYRNEYNPWFKFEPFKRGGHSDTLISYLDDLEGKPRKTWSRKDSLNFAKISLHTGKIDLSEYYFNNLRVDFDTEQEYWWDEMMVKILNKDFEAGIENIHKSQPGILEFSKIYFLDRILLAYKSQETDNKWIKKNNVLKWEVDSSLLGIDKSGEKFRNKIITPIENLDFVLKHLIHYIYEDDPIIAQTCYEMGIILEGHLSNTQAYIAYSLGRHYNKWDKKILTNVKTVKAKLSEKKYKIPIFRRYFPKTEHKHIDSDVLQENIVFQKLDSSNIVDPTLMLPQKKNPLPAFFSQLILTAGILLLFILVLIFLRTKKK